jgi:hypothetical protein
MFLVFEHDVEGICHFFSKNVEVILVLVISNVDACEVPIISNFWFFPSPF